MSNFNVTRRMFPLSEVEKGDSAITITGEGRWRAPGRAPNEGLDLRRLAPGQRVEVQTRNSTYLIQVAEGGTLLVSGHPEHCPTPVPATSIGSVLLTGAIYEGCLAEGMRMEFRIQERRVFTSRMVSVQVL